MIEHFSSIIRKSAITYVQKKPQQIKGVQYLYLQAWKEDSF